MGGVEVEEGRCASGVARISNGRPLALWRGMPPRMHTASGIDHLGQVELHARFSPSGVNGSLKPG